MAINVTARNQSRSNPVSGWSFRFLLPVVCLTALAGQLSAQTGTRDPAFEKIPLDRWLLERDSSHFRWSVKVWPTVLSYQQRLRARVSIQIDGRDMLERRGQGELAMFVQFSDQGGGVYQNHHSLDLQNADEQMKSVYMIWDLDAFVIPGEYRISFAIFHPATGEHSATQRNLHVSPPGGDPLRDAWRGIPPVEFPEVKEPPESWYLPSLAGTLNLPLETQRPVHLNLLLNTTPSELTRATAGKISNQNLSVLIPLLKVITQIKMSNGTLDAALLDMLTQRASFEQHGVGELDWKRLKEALTEANPNLVDARALANRPQMAQFFVREVSRRIAAAGDSKDTQEPLRVLIVLTGPMAFAPGEDLHPIEANANPNFRVYYFRFQPPRSFETSPRMRGNPRRPAMGRPIPGSARSSEQQDYLEGTIKPLKPRVFEFRTPQEFRKALGTMLHEISQAGSPRRAAVLSSFGMPAEP